MTGPGSPPLAWTELERLVAAGDVDTVIVAFTDMQAGWPANGYRAGISSTT